MWTRKDFRRVRRDYERNWVMLVRAFKSGNKALHEECVKKERILDRLERRIGNNLNLLAKEACPNIKVDCNVCEKRNGGCRKVMEGRRLMGGAYGS